jgi:hypothetical protein
MTHSISRAERPCFSQWIYGDMIPIAWFELLTRHPFLQYVNGFTGFTGTWLYGLYGDMIPIIPIHILQSAMVRSNSNYAIGIMSPEPRNPGTPEPPGTPGTPE